MNKLKSFSTILILLVIFSCNSVNQSKDESLPAYISIDVNKKYLNFPVSHDENRGKMKFVIDDKTELEFAIRLSASKPDYWVFYDASSLIGKTLKIYYSGNPKGLTKIYQDEVINGQDSLYKESNRPQIHFTSRRGWNNDPNGLVYLDGEYHLFYQHNPFEREWENMSWGHAISSDLVHWKELPDAMYPDTMGMMFSGSAVIDYKNTSGFGREGISPMVAIYTVDSPTNERQCIAYSLDKGRTFIKYEDNPVIDSKSKWGTKDLRDPAVFWYQPGNCWIMVLYEKDGNSIYSSTNLKEWKYQSHITGFFECPQLFELPVDGNNKNLKWVMYGASGTYMIGQFDGKEFRPESGKHYYCNGSLYAAQTFNNIPLEDGRRIQIAWGRISHPNMPFKSMMLIPTELTLKTTKDGVRLFNVPIKEMEQLQETVYTYNDLDSEQASELLQKFNNYGPLRIKAILKLSHPTEAGLTLFGQPILKYDMNFNLVNGLFYSPEEMTSMEIYADIIMDKTSVEVFIDNGAFSYSFERKAVQGNNDGFKFFGNSLTVKNLEVYPLKSIWSN